MKLTKYEHANLVLEQSGQTLVIDPGNMTSDFAVPSNVVAVVLTHEHADHADASKVQAIMATNPTARIIAHEAAQLVDIAAEKVRAGDELTIGAFTLRFTGGQHALISPALPRVANVGVMVNDLLYYPGDSFTLPERPVEVLALPAAAPWMKLSEAMEFLVRVKPVRAFPTHDAILSDVGKALVDRMLGAVATEQGIEYMRLNSGESIDII